MKPSQRASGFSVWLYKYTDGIDEALKRSGDYGWVKADADNGFPDDDGNRLTIDNADLTARRAAKRHPERMFQVRRGRSPNNEVQSYRETSPLWIYLGTRKYDATKPGRPEAP